jgi:hypothetical protein
MRTREPLPGPRIPGEEVSLSRETIFYYGNS